MQQIEGSEIEMGCMGFSHGYGTAPDRGYLYLFMLSKLPITTAVLSLIQRESMVYRSFISVTMNSLWERWYNPSESKLCLLQSFIFEKRCQQVNGLLKRSSGSIFSSRLRTLRQIISIFTTFTESMRKCLWKK